jgi:hypothetical protein
MLLKTICPGKEREDVDVGIIVTVDPTTVGVSENGISVGSLVYVDVSIRPGAEVGAIEIFGSPEHPIIPVIKTHRNSIARLLIIQILSKSWKLSRVCWHFCRGIISTHECR